MVYCWRSPMRERRWRSCSYFPSLQRSFLPLRTKIAATQQRSNRCSLISLIFSNLPNASRCKSVAQMGRNLILQTRLIPNAFNSRNWRTSKRWRLKGLTWPRTQARGASTSPCHLTLDPVGCLSVRGRKISASWRKTLGWLQKATLYKIPRFAETCSCHDNNKNDWIYWRFSAWEQQPHRRHWFKKRVKCAISWHNDIPGAPAPPSRVLRGSQHWRTPWSCFLFCLHQGEVMNVQFHKCKCLLNTYWSRADLL